MKFILSLIVFLLRLLLLKSGNTETLSLYAHEKELITKSLQLYDNNSKRAAASLGISERTLYRKIRELGL